MAAKGYKVKVKQTDPQKAAKEAQKMVNDEIRRSLNTKEGKELKRILNDPFGDHSKKPKGYVLKSNKPVSQATKDRLMGKKRKQTPAKDIYKRQKAIPNQY